MMTTTIESAPLSVTAIAETARQETRRFALIMVAVNLLLPLGVYLYAHIIGEPYWKLLRGTFNAVSWFSSVQLVLIGILAYGNFELLGLLRRIAVAGAAPRPWVWLVFAVGFILLGLDERFGIHEALRNEVFRPAELFVGNPYLVDGEAGLFLFFFIGLVFTPFLIGELRRWPPATTLFTAALVLTLATIVVDSVKDSAMADWPFQQYRFWDYVFEEVGEIWAQLLFLLSFLIVLHGRLGQLSISESTRQREAQNGT